MAKNISGQSMTSVYLELGASNSSLISIFKEIENKTGFYFAYEPGIMAAYKHISIPKSYRSLDVTLKMLLGRTGLVFKQMNRSILVDKENKIPSLFDSDSLHFILLKTPDIIPFYIAEPGDTLRTITGRIVNDKNEPLEAVSVGIYKNVSRSDTPLLITVGLTDADGTFRIRVPEKTTRLHVSFVGYLNTNISLTADTRYQIVLQPDEKALNDVTVNTGLFSRNRSNFTGASSSFTAEDLAKVSNNNLFSALQVLDPSFLIQENINNGSNPNSTQSLVVRGGNSLNTATSTSSLFKYTNDPNTPLFILDGFETTQERINDLDMNRIAKVDILKDAAATAIYGSRAANGVIVVETKKPAAGKLRATYSGNVTLEMPDLSSYHLLDAQQKMELEDKANVYSYFGWNDIESQLAIIRSARLAAIAKGVNTDWIAQPVRNAVGQKHYVSIEGGDNSVLYGANLTYNQNQGAMKGSNRNTVTGNTFINYRVKNFQFRNDLIVAFNKGNNSPYGTFRQYAQLNPYWTPYDESGNMKFYLEDIRDNDGNRLTNFDGYNNLNYLANVTSSTRPTNPMFNSTLHTKDQTTYQNITDNFSFIWQVTPRLRIRNNFSFQKQKDESDYFLPSQATQFAAQETFSKGIYTKGYGNRNSLENVLTVDYNKSWGKHQIFATGAGNISEIKYDSYNFSVQGFPNQNMEELTSGNKFPDNSKPVGSENISRLLGLVSQVSYNYDNRYLADLSFREDGSSQFGSNNHFAPFWSTGVGWNLQNENFLKSARFVDRLKLRYSIGYTGSQNFPSYLGVTTTQYYLDREYRGVIGSYLLGYGNPDLKWQKTLKHNFGADITLFKKLNITANYYIENTTGSVATISTAPSTGFSSYSANLGNVKAKGWEVYANYTIYNDTKSRSNWSVFLNVTGVKSKITKLSKEIAAMNEVADTSYSSTPIVRYAEGQSTTAIWAVRSLGIDPSTGQEIYLDRNDNIVSEYNPLDKKIVGDTRPDARGSFGTNLEYKGIGLNAYFLFQIGGQAFNQTLIDRVENVDLKYYNTDRRVLEDRWQKAGDHTFFKGITTIEGVTVTDPTYASSRFVQNYNYLTLSSLSVFYRFSDKLNNRLKLSNTKITLYTGDLFFKSSVQREMGIDYPYSRSVTLQLTTSF